MVTEYFFRPNVYYFWNSQLRLSELTGRRCRPEEGEEGAAEEKKGGQSEADVETAGGDSDGLR